VGGPLALTGHIRIADVPGRNEPGTGEMNYPFVLDHRASDGPPGARWAWRTEDSFGWLD
jgi:hydroxypyruvate isomerase